MNDKSMSKACARCSQRVSSFSLLLDYRSMLARPTSTRWPDTFSCDVVVAALSYSSERTLFSFSCPSKAVGPLSIALPLVPAFVPLAFPMDLYSSFPISSCQ